MYIVTEILPNGKFKAIEKLQREELVLMGNESQIDNYAETFDITPQIDTSNPIYKFYEKDLAKYLKGKYKAELVTDEK